MYKMELQTPKRAQIDGRGARGVDRARGVRAGMIWVNEWLAMFPATPTADTG